MDTKEEEIDERTRKRRKTRTMARDTGRQKRRHRNKGKGGNWKEERQEGSNNAPSKIFLPGTTGAL